MGGRPRCEHMMILASMVAANSKKKVVEPHKVRPSGGHTTPACITMSPHMYKVPMRRRCTSPSKRGRNPASSCSVLGYRPEKTSFLTITFPWKRGRLRACNSVIIKVLARYMHVFATMV